MRYYLAAPFGADRRDASLARIIGEGSARAVRAKVKEWAPLAPGRYQALPVDQVDARVLLDWQRFGTDNPHWVIADES